jgi:hypothetical protein
LSSDDGSEAALAVSANAGTTGASVEVDGAILRARWGTSQLRTVDLSNPFTGKLGDVRVALQVGNPSPFTVSVLAPFTNATPGTVLIEQTVTIPDGGAPAEIRGTPP